MDKAIRNEIMSIVYEGLEEKGVNQSAVVDSQKNIINEEKGYNHAVELMSILYTTGLRRRQTLRAYKYFERTQDNI